MMRALIYGVFLCLLASLSQANTLPDFSQFTDVKQKKYNFFNYLRPMAERANQSVLKQRQQLLKLKQTQSLSAKDKNWLDKISKEYNVQQNAPHKAIDALLSKVDKVPVSLLLAQAANESAWGTSRFARLGNNLFGQWCYTKHCGLVPTQRSQGATHEVQIFASPYESIKAYQLNLNRNNSYQTLRNIRAKLRDRHKTISGLQLAEGLSHYSERGEAYVKEIKQMIKGNHLTQYDNKA